MKIIKATIITTMIILTMTTFASSLRGHGRTSFSHRPTISRVHHPKHIHPYHSMHRHHGIINGIIGSVISSVAVRPIVITKTIWVNGWYEDVVQTNGTIVKIWHPGHWETVEIKNF